LLSCCANREAVSPPSVSKKRKIRENLDAEIFDVCLNEAKEKGYRIKIINTTKGLKNIKDFI